MPKLLDYTDFCKDLPSIISTRIIDKKKFHPQGLFSEQIFGPINNYTCQCGTYHGISKAGSKCDMCQVDIVNSDERRKRFARINLPIPVVNPLFYDLIITISGTYLKTQLDQLMKNEKSILYVNDQGCDVVTAPEKIPPGSRTYERTDAILELVKMAAEEAPEDNEGWKLILNNIDKLLISDIIVLPPDLRPAAKGINKNNQVLDKINRYYVQILQKKEVMKDTFFDIQRDKNLYYSYFKQLQKDVNELYTHILEKLSKKEGLIRGNILGKRIDFSGRAVIVPDPTLSLNECRIPYFMFLEIYKLPIAKKLIEYGQFQILNSAIDYVDNCIDTESFDLYDICEELSKNEVCILNRQPSLHRLGFLGFDLKLTKDSVIKIHPLICPPFNADFDGDQMAVYIPVSEEAKKEIRDKIFISKNLSSPSNQSLTTTPSQDIILGIYALTSKKIPDTLEEVVYKNETISKAEVEFNKCLPNNYPVIKGVVDKTRLISLLNDIKDHYDENITMNVLDEIKKLGFKYSTLFGTTMSLLGFKWDDSCSFRDNLFECGTTSEQLVTYSDEKIVEYLRKNFKYSFMIDSGARGSWDQAKQIILSRGFIANSDGDILPDPIKHSLLEGLTQEEFFNSTYGCRKGLLDVAVNTGTSGYLSRKLIFTCANLQIDSSLKDCGTTDLLEVFVETEKKAKMLINRYYVDKKELKQITKENYQDIIGQTILIRSPIYCKSPKLCTTCYGDLYKSLHSRFVGVIAAQTLGERGTQLVLRTFHTSGSAVIKDHDDEEEVDLKQMDIIDDLKEVSKTLHKLKNKNCVQITSELFDAYSSNQDIEHIHFECVVSQMMWVGPKKWRLMDEREKFEPTYFSVQSVPSNESWILGLAFSNPKRHILKGILNSGSYKGILDKILLGERIK
jgi:DNA-directed RNA polymerase subunit beta'